MKPIFTAEDFNVMIAPVAEYIAGLVNEKLATLVGPKVYGNRLLNEDMRDWVAARIKTVKPAQPSDTRQGEE